MVCQEQYSSELKEAVEACDKEQSQAQTLTDEIAEVRGLHGEETERFRVGQSFIERGVAAELALALLRLVRRCIFLISSHFLFWPSNC